VRAQSEAVSKANGEAVAALRTESADMREALGQMMDMLESTATQQDLADAQVGHPGFLRCASTQRNCARTHAAYRILPGGAWMSIHLNGYLCVRAGVWCTQAQQGEALEAAERTSAEMAGQLRLVQSQLDTTATEIMSQLEQVGREAEQEEQRLGAMIVPTMAT
jgi:hypothetical protein